MGRIIAIANQKGGVGKTTTAVNLAASLAAAEQPTLLIDIDPQANATSGLGVGTKDLEKTVYEVIVDRMSPRDAILHTELGDLDLIPSHINLVGAEIEMIDVPGREKVLYNALAEIRGRYNYIIIDCPPSLGLLTLNALTASDAVLIPVQCEYYALEGLGQLLNTIAIVKKHLNPSLDIEGVLLTMFDKRLNLSNQVSEEVRRYFGDKVFKTMIARNVRLSEAPSHGKPVLLYDALSIGTQNYMELANEVLRHTIERPEGEASGRGGGNDGGISHRPDRREGESSGGGTAIPSNGTDRPPLNEPSENVSGRGGGTGETAPDRPDGREEESPTGGTFPSNGTDHPPLNERPGSPSPGGEGSGGQRTTTE